MSQFATKDLHTFDAKDKEGFFKVARGNSEKTRRILSGLPYDY